MNHDFMKRDFEDLLESLLAETEAQLGSSVEVVATVAADQAMHLANLDPLHRGYGRAVRASRDVVMLASAIQVVHNADAFEARWKGALQGALRMGAQALRIALGLPAAPATT